MEESDERNKGVICAYAVGMNASFQSSKSVRLVYHGRRVSILPLRTSEMTEEPKKMACLLWGRRGLNVACVTAVLGECRY